MPLDPNAIPGLLRALDSFDVYVRIVAAEALGKIGNPIAVRRLVETLDDPRPDVRRRVVKALTRIGTEPRVPSAAQVVPGLERGLYDAEPSVQWAAESGLRTLNTSAARAALSTWESYLASSEL
jgi:HEAT repeat protein